MAVSLLRRALLADSSLRQGTVVLSVRRCGGVALCADSIGSVLLPQELQPGPHDAGDVTGAVAPGATYVAAGIAGLLHAGPEGRPNQLHCRQPAVPTTSVDTIVKTNSLDDGMDACCRCGWLPAVQLVRANFLPGVAAPRMPTAGLDPGVTAPVRHPGCVALAPTPVAATHCRYCPAQGLLCAPTN